MRIVRTATWMAAAAGGMSIAAGTFTALHFNENDPWFSVGEFVFLMSFGLALGAFFTRKRGIIDDAYQLGYRDGLYKGQRIRPRVIRLEPDREPSLHR